MIKLGRGVGHLQILSQSGVRIISTITVRSTADETIELAIEHIAGSTPGVLFCSGFKSNMQGNKVQHLRDYCSRLGWQFTAFDYRGHGSSGGKFEDSTISDWVQDACTVLDQACTGTQIVVGSSMGGWIALRLGQLRPERIKGLLGIATAPDFTERLIWQALPLAQQEHLATGGSWCLPSNSDDNQEYRINYHLIESGRDNSVLTQPLELPFPVHLLHGTGDEDVPWQLSGELLEHLQSPNASLTLCKEVDHRFSGEAQLQLISQVVTDMRGLRVPDFSTRTPA